jgi:hypothetical protein
LISREISVNWFSKWILRRVALWSPFQNMDSEYILVTAHTLQRHNIKNSKQIFPEKELRGYSLNTHIHVSVSDLYISLISLPILLQENRWTKRGII